MSRCVILAAGPFNDAEWLSGLLVEDDYIIAADGGLRLACAMGAAPDMVVADFDSAGTSEVQSGVKVITLPRKKDETDTAYALRWAYDAGYREFLLLGCTGGRLDHWQAVLAIAADYTRRGCDMVMADEQNEVRLLTPGAYAFPVNKHEKVSFFAFGGEVTGLFADGLYYDITNMTLSPFDPLCVSNECIDEDFQIVFKDGLLMLYITKD